MRGVRLFGSRGYSYEVSLKLYSVQGRNESDQELCSVEGCFTTDAEYTDGYYGFDVLFDRPVSLEANVQYRICANISGTSSWYGSSGLNMVECDGIIFKFNGQTSPNGTNDSGGQFPQILFHECWWCLQLVFFFCFFVLLLLLLLLFAQHLTSQSTAIILDPQDLLVSVFNSNNSIIMARCEKITLETVRGVTYLHWHRAVIKDQGQGISSTNCEPNLQLAIGYT